MFPFLGCGCGPSTCGGGDLGHDDAVRVIDEVFAGEPVDTFAVTGQVRGCNGNDLTPPRGGCLPHYLVQTTGYAGLAERRGNQIVEATFHRWHERDHGSWR